MKYSLKELFEVIDEKKSEFEFYEEDTGEFGVDYYLDLITYFEPDNKYDIVNGRYLNIIKAHYRFEKLKNLNKNLKQIDVSGILVYEYIPHVEDFRIFRVKDIKEAEEFMCSNLGLLGIYTGDIVILENGKRKKFFIKDFKGNILTWCDGSMLQDKETGELLFTIEWEN